jgi:hypothetical protein
LDWLGQFRGDTWQQRWLACGIADDGQLDWRPAVARWLVGSGHAAAGTARLQVSVTSGLGQLIYADIVRPGLPWLVSSPVRYPFGHEMPRVRDSGGFAALNTRATAAGAGFDSRRRAVEQIAMILAAKGGTIADVTVGDCLELGMETARHHQISVRARRVRPVAGASGGKTASTHRAGGAAGDGQREPQVLAHAASRGCSRAALPVRVAGRPVAGRSVG